MQATSLRLGGLHVDELPGHQVGDLRDDLLEDLGHRAGDGRRYLLGSLPPVLVDESVHVLTCAGQRSVALGSTHSQVREGRGVRDSVTR